MTSLIDERIYATIALQLKEVGHGPISERAHLAPTPPADMLLGHARFIWDDPLEFMLRAMREQGDVVRMRLGPYTWHALFHPDHVEHVLVHQRQNYTKRSRGYEKLRRVIGQGLLTSEGEEWARNRRLIAPAFQPHRLMGFARTMVQAALDSAERLAMAPAARPVDVAGEMMRLTLRVAGETLLGSPENWDYERVRRALGIVLEEVNHRILGIFEIPEAIPTTANIRFQYAMRVLESTVEEIIRQRRRRPVDPNQDLLAMLMAARDEATGEVLSDRQLRDEAMTMFLAGHETTANALTWTWCLLSEHPEAGRKLCEELARVLGGRNPIPDDLPRLTYTRMLLMESMRLRPPVWGTVRSVERDDTIGGYHIPAGSEVVLCPYATHRHPRFWDNPLGFDPERFSPERSQGRHRHAYFPFSVGPRACIGNHFAMLEMTLVVATIAQRLRFDLVPGMPVVPEAVVTLKPKHGLWMTVQPQRKPESAGTPPRIR